MKVAISGANGFVGSALSKHLDSQGHRVIALVRKHEEPGVFWNPLNAEVDAHGLEGLDAIVHLAGENVAARRWSVEQKKRILESRVNGTTLLIRTVSKLSRPPRVFLSASAAGYYGPSVRQALDESGPAGEGFLAEVCRAWEAAAKQSFLPSTRLVIARLGMVLGPGGVLEKLLPIFRLGLGACLGDGRQWMSWISLRDTVRAFSYCLEHAEIGPTVNFVSPKPATNREFTKALGLALRRPTFGMVPPFALRLLYGEMARETALASSRIIPRTLLEKGFTFLDTDLEATLKEIVREQKKPSGS